MENAKQNLIDAFGEACVKDTSNGCKANVKEVSADNFFYLAECHKTAKVAIKRSGAGVVILVEQK